MVFQTRAQLKGELETILGYFNNSNKKKLTRFASCIQKSFWKYPNEIGVPVLKGFSEFPETSVGDIVHPKLSN